MRCEKCGTIAGSNDLFCPECGQKLEKQSQQMNNQPYNSTVKSVVKYCPNCRTEMFADEVFCPNCGANTNNPASDMYSSGGTAYYADPNSGKEEKNNNGIIIAVVIASVAVVLLAVVIVLLAFSNNSDSGSSDDDNNTVVVTQKPEEGNEQIYDEQTYETKNDSEYFYPSHERYITRSELNSYSRDEIRLILNEMYARHGYIFKLEEYSSYFLQQDWYSPRYENQETAQAFFNSYEEANRLTIIEYEESKGWR